jgi:hypothetical protein
LIWYTVDFCQNLLCILLLSHFPAWRLFLLHRSHQSIKCMRFTAHFLTFLASYRPSILSLEQQTTFLLLNFVLKFSFTAEFTTISMI